MAEGRGMFFFFFAGKYGYLVTSRAVQIFTGKCKLFTTIDVVLGPVHVHCTVQCSL